MSDEKTNGSARKWYVASWPPLPWLETVVKLAAIVIGIAAFTQALSEAAFALPRGLRLVQFTILAFLSLGLVAAILDRFKEREIVAMIFVLLNNLGHWGMVVALASVPGPGAMLIAFAGLMLLGDLVKLVFFKVHDFSVRGRPQVVLYLLTSVYFVGYLIILLLELMR